MSEASTISFALPCKVQSDTKETKTSLALRATAVVLGILAMTIAALALFQVPVFSGLSGVGGWSVLSAGAVTILLSSVIRCNKSIENAEETSQPDSTSPDQTIQESEHPQLSERQREILREFTPEMVDALGGIQRVQLLPRQNCWNGRIDTKDLTASIAVGSYLMNGREYPYLLFCYCKFSDRTGKYHVTGDWLGRTENGWCAPYAYPSELNLRSANTVTDGSPEAGHMLDKIKRLVNREAIGKVERYRDVLLVKPEERDEWRPENARLEGEALDQFMDLDTIFYERKPEEGSTDLFPYTPNHSALRNIADFYQAFPDKESIDISFKQID